MRQPSSAAGTDGRLPMRPGNSHGNPKSRRPSRTLASDDRRAKAALSRSCRTGTTQRRHTANEPKAATFRRPAIEPQSMIRTLTAEGPIVTQPMKPLEPQADEPLTQEPAIGGGRLMLSLPHKALGVNASIDSRSLPARSKPAARMRRSASARERRGRYWTATVASAWAQSRGSPARSSRPEGSLLPESATTAGAASNRLGFLFKRGSMGKLD